MSLYRVRPEHCVPGASHPCNDLRLQDKFLSQEVFLSLPYARVRVGIWRKWYDEERPHSSLGYQTPSEFAQKHAKGAQVHRAETADEQ